jgi:MFS family permease
MSENVLVALIAAIGAVVGGIAGAVIEAYATIRAANPKTGQRPEPPSPKPRKGSPHWAWGIAGGAIIGAAVVLGVLLVAHPYREGNFSPKSADTVAGEWIGTTTWNDLQLETKLSIRQGCTVGGICGTTRSEGEFYCTGDLVLSRIEGDTFIFIEQDENGNAPKGCPSGAVQYLRLLSTGQLSWSISRDTGGNPGSGSGILVRP